MQDNISNRMPAKRGRPFAAAVQDPQPAENVMVPQPPAPGIRCPKCGRGMVPRLDRTESHRGYCNCTLCGIRLFLTYKNGEYQSVRQVGPGGQ